MEVIKILHVYGTLKKHDLVFPNLGSDGSVGISKEWKSPIEGLLPAVRESKEIENNSILQGNVTR